MRNSRLPNRTEDQNRVEEPRDSTSWHWFNWICSRKCSKLYKNGQVFSGSKQLYLIRSFICHTYFLFIPQSNSHVFQTSHMQKTGFRQGPSHYLILEEVIYLMDLGAVAVVTDPKSSKFLSLNQLYSMLPLFNLSLFQFCAFRSLTKANYRVRKAPENQ